MYTTKHGKGQVLFSLWLVMQLLAFFGNLRKEWRSWVNLFITPRSSTPTSKPFTAWKLNTPSRSCLYFLFVLSPPWENREIQPKPPTLTSTNAVYFKEDGEFGVNVFFTSLGMLKTVLSSKSDWWMIPPAVRYCSSVNGGLKSFPALRLRRSGTFSVLARWRGRGV